jgi:S-adenosylmethionine:tRNA ribosyltransferase-isomerase
MSLQTELPVGMRLSDYDYVLPPERIAQYPLTQRDQSKMMVLNRQGETLAHHHFYQLPELLKPGDLVIVNNTKVIPARLLGHRRGHTGKVEVLLMYPDAQAPTLWEALMKPTRKLAIGTIIELPGTDAVVEVVELGQAVRGKVRLHLNSEPTVFDLLERVGHIPIPPYLNRPAEEADKETYQTVYSQDHQALPGSQAAPTAGLHFTPAVIEALKTRGIGLEAVTLSVSSGTFRSVADEDITRHRMDPEIYAIPESVVEAVQRTKAQGGRVVAIGTTVAKTLESSAFKHNGQIKAEMDWSQLFIYPGFQFQVVDAMVTNFHLPKTTLLMMISAFSNRDFVLRAYNEAVREEYRFFSYGDCMLIL